MRVWLVVVVLLTVCSTPILTQHPSLDVEVGVVHQTSPVQTTISPNTGWMTGGEERLIHGSGFTDLAYRNTSYDGIEHEWVETTADSTFEAGHENAIVVDSNGHVHVVHANGGTHELRHTSFDGTTWNSMKIKDCERSYCVNTHMVIDDNDELHAAYYAQGGYVMYMHHNGTDWSSTVVSSSAAYGGIGVAVDSSNNPHISYAASGNYCGSGLRLSSFNGSGWSTQTVDQHIDRGCDSALVIDGNDQFNIAYQSRDDSKMKLATDNSGSWNIYVADAGESLYDLHPGYFLSMAIDEQGQVHIAHFDDENKDLRYSTGVPNGEWTSTIVDSAGNTGHNPSIGLDVADHPHIVYQTWSGFNVKYATIDPTTSEWAVHTISNNGDVGGSNSLFIDHNSVIHVAFSDESNDVLRYASKPTGVSLTQEVTIQFGQEAAVTGTVLNDSTIRVTTPSVNTTGTVNLTLVDNNGEEHLLSANFRFVDQDDLDSDGVLNPSDDCPEVAGTSTHDLTGCPDDDGDGYSDAGDAFAFDASEWLDTDGDGTGDNSDVFPNDANETTDTDGDGVGDNSDAFPMNAFDHLDSDGDGVGDNADAFPNDPNETADSDGDGVGDNSDAFPQNAFEQRDSDGDGVGDNTDAFPNDASQTMDSDGDGVGDFNDLCSQTLEDEEVDRDGCSQGQLDGDGDGYFDTNDAFPLDSTQWLDSDGDGYGDNWGESDWNASRLAQWQGIFVPGALQPDYCPDESGDSTADGYFGCLDEDGDTIADRFQQNATNQNDTQLNTDTDNDGVTDVNDDCPGTTPNAITDAYGCEVKDEQEENTPLEGFKSFFSGEADAVTTTVGVGAILLALFTVLQTNVVASVLPDAFRWVRVLRTNSNLTKEERNELTYLQSLVQAYAEHPQELVEELLQLKNDLTGRYTNNEIKKETREKLYTLIDDLLNASPQELYRIAHNEGYFGLTGTLDSGNRTELLNENIAMRASTQTAAAVPFGHQSAAATYSPQPPANAVGTVRADGLEWYESHHTSGEWWFRRAHTNEPWKKWSPPSP